MPRNAKEVNMSGLNDILSGTYTFEVTARGVTTSPQQWQNAIEAQIESYTHTGYTITTQATDEPRKWYMILKVDGTYEDVMDRLLEDIIQVTGNFHADDGLYVKYTDPEGRLVNEYEVRCTCGDHAVNEAIEWR
jgi:hypothetical protein